MTDDTMTDDTLTGGAVAPTPSIQLLPLQQLGDPDSDACEGDACLVPVKTLGGPAE